jgi:hypothetical protein
MTPGVRFSHETTKTNTGDKLSHFSTLAYATQIEVVNARLPNSIEQSARHM